MTTIRPVPLDVRGDLTLLDLILVVQQFTTSDSETVEIVSSLMDSGRVRVRSPEKSSDRGMQPLAMKGSVGPPHRGAIGGFRSG